MTPEQFNEWAVLVSDPVLLVMKTGQVLAANPAVQRLGLTPAQMTGHSLQDFSTTPREKITNLLRLSARSRHPVVSALTLRLPDGGEIPCRCDGLLADHDPSGRDTRLLLKLTPKQSAVQQFRLVNQKILELNRELHRRKQLEQDLYQRNELLHVTLASIGDAVIATDLQGRVTFLNAVAQELTGWQGTAALGLPLTVVFRIINEQTRQPVESPVEQALQVGGIVGLANHTVLIARDGTERPIEDSAAPIRDASGNLLGVVLIFRDASEKRVIEIQQGRLAALVTSSEDAILGQTFEGTITHWNAGAERLFGWTAAEAVGQSVFSLIVAPDRQQELLDALNRVRRGEQVPPFETVRIPKHGLPLPVSASISPIRNAEGQIVEASTIDRDVTQRKQLEQSLRFLAEASKSLSMLVDYHSTLQQVAQLAVPDFADWVAVDILDPEGALQRLAVAHANPAKVELAGELHRRYPPAPDTPRGVMNVLRTGQAELTPRIGHEMLEAAARDEEHLRILRELELKSYICVPLKTKNRNLGVISFLTAESGRLYGPDDLTMAEDLAHRAAVAVENALLYEELRDTARHKDEFLATLSHELRNPLAPLRTGLKVIGTAGDNRQLVDEALAVMERQVEQMVRLIDDLLDVSRITQNKLTLRKSQVALADIVRNAVDTAKPLIDQGKHRLSVTLPSEPVLLDADPIRLAQVFANLLTNSAKYTEEGGRIWLMAEQEGSEVVVAVRDTGIGISPDHLPKLFTMFSQAASALERSQGGLGIGLALVSRLVEMHGGVIEARSEGPDRGSQFIVRLPAPVAPRSESALTTAPVSEQEAAPQSLRILVVDDNKAAARMLAVLLRSRGHEIHTAHDGQAAVDKAVELQPDVILLDIGMPVLNGYEACRRIRELPGGNGITLIALTGWGRDEDQRIAIEAGFDHHCTKPVDITHLNPLLARRTQPG